MKRAIIILAALAVTGIANAKFVACPANIASAHDGQVIKYKGETWKVNFVSNQLPVDFPINVTYPGLVKTNVEGKAALACYDDDKRANRAVGRPLYSLILMHQGLECKDPRINNEKKGFDCL